MAGCSISYIFPCIFSDESMAVFTVDSLVLATEKRTVIRDVVYKALVASAYNGAMRDLNLIIRDSIFVTAQGNLSAHSSL